MKKSLRPDTKLVDFAENDLLDVLNGRALVVLIRIVAFSAKRGRRMVVDSCDLMPGGGKVVARALDELEKMKLVKCSYEVGPRGGVIQRTVELLA